MDLALQQLWQEHIKSITSLLHKLNKEVETVKSHLSKDSLFLQDNQYQNASINQQTKYGVLFVKGGIARCDSSIAKLVSDIHHQKSVISTQVEKLKHEDKLNQHVIESMENQIKEICVRLDKLTNCRQGKMSVIHSVNNKQIDGIDVKIKRNLEEILDLVYRNSKWAKSERHRIEKQLIELVDGNVKNSNLKQELFEEKILRRIDDIQRFVEQCKKDCRRCRNDLRSTADDNDAAQRFEVLELKFLTEVCKLKKEYRDGFLSIKESIGSTNQVVDGKIKLVQNQLLTEVHHLKRLTVLI